MKKSEEFLKNVKKGGIGKLIVGIVLILIAASSIASVYFIEQDEKKKSVDLYDANGTDLYAKLDVQFLSDYFAVSTGNSKLKSFIACDKNNVLYLVDLNEDTIAELQKIFDYSQAVEEPEEVPDPVTIYGKTAEIDSELKKLAISYYNELIGEEVLNNSNFEKYFGRYYLDTSMKFTDSTLFGSILFGGIFSICGLILVITFVLNKNRTKKALAKYTDSEMYKLLDSIDSETCYFNKKTKIYFTDTCIISYMRGLEVIDYKDIVWIYPHEYRYRGAITKSIYVVTKDSKVHIFSQLNMNKKTSIMFDEEYQTLINRNPEVLLGYTTENAKKAKELYKKK